MLLKYMDSIEETNIIDKTNIIDSIVETTIIDKTNSIVETTIIDKTNSIVETTIIDSIVETTIIDSIVETTIIEKNIENDIENNELIKHLKQTSCFKSVHGIYGDSLHKIAVMWSPRAGCSITFQCFLDINNLLNEALNYNNFIHVYRMDIYQKNVPSIPLKQLIKENYIIIKSIVNPYSRAVSIWRGHISMDKTISFKEYMKQLINETIILSKMDRNHTIPQYITNEESYITKYIKLDLNETYTIQLNNETDYIIDINKYTSTHHGVKTEHTNYCGDICRKDIILPKSYKYFYDEETKKMVEDVYGIDIKMYNYSFEDMI